MITLAIATLLIGQGAVTVACPMTGEASPASGKAVDYNGVRYTMCCGGCDGAFKKDPAAALKSDKLKGKLVGVSLFNPVTGLRITEKASKGSADFNGVRYYFASVDEKVKFEADPKKFSTAPAKEALYCPVMGHELKDYATAGGYVDVENVRYYTCCPDCSAAMKKDAASFAAKAKSAVKPVAAMDAPVKKS